MEPEPKGYPILPDAEGSVRKFHEDLAEFLRLDDPGSVFVTKSELIEEKLGDVYGYGSEEYMQRTAFIDFMRGCYAFNDDDAEDAIRHFAAAYDVFATLAEQCDSLDERCINRLFALRTSTSQGNLHFITSGPRTALTYYDRAMVHAGQLLDLSVPGAVRQEVYTSLESMLVMIATSLRSGSYDIEGLKPTYIFLKQHEIRIPYTPNAVANAREQTISLETLEILGGIGGDLDKVQISTAIEEVEDYIHKLEDTKFSPDAIDPETEKNLELGQMHLNLATLYLCTGDYVKAIHNLDESACLFLEAEYMSLVAEALSIKSIALYRGGLLVRAEQEAEEAVEYFYSYFLSGLASDEVASGLQRLIDFAYEPIKQMQGKDVDIMLTKQRFKDLGIALGGFEESTNFTVPGKNVLDNLVDYDPEQYYTFYLN